MAIKKILALFFMSLALLTPSSDAAERPRVFVSVLPQKYFVQRIAGDMVDVDVMVETGANPATYEPRPRQMAELSKTRAYFSVGVPFEETWLPRFRAANPGLRVFPTQEGILRLPMKGHRHDDGDKDTHNGDRPDPHIWLSPRLVMLQARNILLDLSTIFPDEAPFFRKNYRAFLQEIGEIDTLLLERFGPKSGNRQFLVFHPSWGYFARDYGLEQIPIEIEGKAPRQKDLLRLMETGRKKGWKTVFVQPQFSDKSATALAQNLGATIVPLDPLAENWGENILMAASLIEESLR